MVISTLVSRLRAAARCQPKPNPKPNPNPNRNPTLTTLTLTLTLTLNRYLHYICTMAPDWVRMPLTIWYNGGPGAPSTYGLFQEFGPFILTEESYLTPGALRLR